MEEIIMPTPGIADPYFYEWYVGIKYLIEMLNPDSGIKCVVFQHELYDTIDDVVVEYNNGSREVCYQVKHEIETSSKHNLTFGKLIEEDPKSESRCLLDALFQGWKKASSASTKMITPVLYTNRKLGENKPIRKYNNKKYTFYPIEEFFVKIKEELKNTTVYGGMLIQDENLSKQWGVLCHSINETNINEIADFIKVFEIKGNEPGLAEMEATLISSLMSTFSCSEGLANELLGKIMYGLREWVTTKRETSRVTIEDVYSAISVENDVNESQHRLAPPFPFFESRKRFSESIKNQICSSSKKVVFISGEPGSGKTSVISYLQSTTNMFLLRYHTFRPISPEQHFYNVDAGICSGDALWGTLLIQLRQKLSGKLAKYSVPVNNKLLTMEMKRHHVCRLLGIMAKESAQKNERIYVCIDGIDHAARSKTAVTFLSSLPLPNEIPDGVCFVIVGQPYNMYRDEYPLWLSSNTEVEYISVPNIDVDDIKQLIIETVPQFIDNAEGISKLVYSFTKGNNLSSVFAVEEIKKAQSPEDAVNILNNCGITYDIQQYYSHIWNHAKKIISESELGVPFPESIIACPILLMNGRVHTGILANALPYNLNENDWKMVLDMLYPLIIPCNENNDEYTLFHNDFRIFLMHIINGYQARYEEIALHLAEYLLNNDEGLTSYILSIPLLQCANHVELIPKYFTSGFVINALAEGVSKQRLDEYAHLSYNAACANRDKKGYINTYLALTTLYQHNRYIKYYERTYISKDAPELSNLDLSEIRNLPFSFENIEEYTNVLELCEKLNLNKKEERSIALYGRWFDKLTPYSFIPLMQGEKTLNDKYPFVDNCAKNALKKWGKTAALLEMEPPIIDQPINDVQIKVLWLFGVEYFKCCIENGLIDLAFLAIERYYVTSACLFEQLESIYYNGYTDKFAKHLMKLVNIYNEGLTNYFPIAMLATNQYENNFGIETKNLLKSPNSIYDKTSMDIVVQSFLVGAIERNKDDIVICSHVCACYDKIADSGFTKNQISYLCKFSCLLGKYYWNESACNSTAFIKYTLWFLVTKLERTHDYSSAYKFLIFTLFNSKAAESLVNNEDFISAIRIALLENRHPGMYYKTYMLDYLEKVGRKDIIKDHISTLYGENCKNISKTEDRFDMHKRFCHYGEIVEPDLMHSFTNKLKWDVVGYVNHKEYAMNGIHDELDMILSDKPFLWRELGLDLYHQSKIASLSGNEYDYEIRKCLLKAAISCSIEDFWDLHSLDDDFRLNPSLIYESIFKFVDKANCKEDVEAIWMLNCGLHSWYTNEDRINAKNVYQYLFEKSQSFGINLDIIINDITPQWMEILKHSFDKTEAFGNKIDSYDVQKQEAIARTSEKCGDLNSDNIIDFIQKIPLFDYPYDIYKIVIDHIKSKEMLDSNVLNCLLSSLCSYSKNREWRIAGLTDTISSILNLMGEEAFWNLASIIEEHLSEYDYQTSTRNIQLLLIQNCKMNAGEVKYLFNRELETQQQWVTANNHLEVSDLDLHSNSRLASPQSIADIALFILLEQLETNNARKIESAVYSIYVWGCDSPYIVDLVIHHLSNLLPTQKEWVYLIIMRWASEKRVSSELCSILTNEYITCNSLSQKYYLHSILLKIGSDQVRLNDINYDALPIEYSLPKDGIVDRNSIYERFLSFRETEDFYGENDDIRRYISLNSLEKSHINDMYGERNDICIPTHNQKVDCMLYGEGKKGRWNDITLTENKCLLIPIDDPYMLTDMPKMVFDNSWFPNIYDNQHRAEKEIDKKTLLKIALSNIDDHDVMLAAVIWYPVEHKKYLTYNVVTKIGSADKLSNNNEFALCTGSYGLLESEGQIIQSDPAYRYSHSINLFDIVRGLIRIPFGNCQISPSFAWKQLLKCSVSSTSPYLWINELGKTVLRFERFASPINDEMSEIYFSQPILFRWICDKEWLNSKLEEMNLRRWYIEKIREERDLLLE